MLQYIANRATDKAMAVAFKRNRFRSSQYYRVEETWGNIKLLAENGYTIGRVGTTTSFIFLDIDESDITHEEMEKALASWPDTLVLKGTSGKWYKHHVIIRTGPITIRPEGEGPRELVQAPFIEAVHDAFARVQALFPGRRLELDSHSDRYWQCLYSYCEVDDPDPQALPIRESVALQGWAHKYTKGSELHKGTANPRPVPLNQWALNRQFHRERRDDVIRLDWDTFTFGKEGKRRKLVGKGHRAHAEPRLIAAAVYFARYCNAKYGTDFTEDDIRHTVESVIVTQFADGKRHLEERLACIRKLVLDEWRASGTASFQLYGANRLQAASGKAKIGYMPQSLDAKVLWDEYHGSICTSDATHAIDLIYSIAEGDVIIAKSLKRRYDFCIRKQDPSGHKRKKANYDQVVADATCDANGRYIFPKQYIRNRNFRQYLVKRGIGQFGWL